MHYDDTKSFLESIIFSLSCWVILPSMLGGVGWLTSLAEDGQWRTKLSIWGPKWQGHWDYITNQGRGRERLIKSDTWNKQKIEEVQSWVKAVFKKGLNMTSLLSEKTCGQTAAVVYSLLTKSIVLWDTAPGPLMLCTAAIFVNRWLFGVPHSWAHNVGGDPTSMWTDLDANLPYVDCVYMCIHARPEIVVLERRIPTHIPQ